MIQSNLHATNLSWQTRVGQTQVNVCERHNNSWQTCWQTVGDKGDKFYMSPTVCQHKFATFSLSFEGRFKLF